MSKAFIDITPVIYDEYGNYHQLGVVRYEVDSNWGELARASYAYYVNPVNIGPGYPTHKIAFECKLVSAELPQPQRLDVVSAYPVKPATITGEELLAQQAEIAHERQKQKLMLNATYGKGPTRDGLEPPNGDDDPRDYSDRPDYPTGV